MQFYPHNFPITSIANAVSASLAVSSSLIANFTAIPITIVNTASVALNITGSVGTNGTSQTVTGPKGPIGFGGQRGLRGNSIFLLSGSWNTGNCVPNLTSTCYEVINYNSSTSGIITWTDANGVSRTGTLGGNQSTFICSRTIPYESPVVDVFVNSCGVECFEVCTTLPCEVPCTC